MSKRPRIIDAVTAMLSAGPRPSAVVVDALTGARDALAAREADVQTAKASYEASLDEGREAALAARARLSEAEVDADIARRQVAKLEAEAEQARQAERRAETDRLVGEADAAIERYRAAIAEDLPLITKAVRNLIGLRALAEIANNAAKAAITADSDPTRHAPRQGVDAFRNRPGRPRKIVGGPRDVLLWVDAHGQAPADEYQDRIRPQPDGSGILRLPNASPRYTAKRWFREVTCLPLEVGETAENLAEVVRIPALVAGGPPGWKPIAHKSPEAILRLLDDLEAASAADLHRDTRQPRTELEPLGAPFDVVAERRAEREAAGREHDDEAA
ncbi:MAG: hypothetical protein K2X71_18975 [Methylobacterium sp.]|uniref:hypothetical protein n=1 Tax=Methylobacterium sp. TaxID=409 RepID=UPI002589A6FB|nr:hypothetical protein [Methylobacterium sp.]MBY0298085.1 hypothetical protein [Methylobacterium sp.]